MGEVGLSGCLVVGLRRLGEEIAVTCAAWLCCDGAGGAVCWLYTLDLKILFYALRKNKPQFV